MRKFLARQLLLQRKNLYTIVALMLVTFTAEAQPTMYKTGGTASTSTGGFTTGTRKIQLVYNPADLTNASQGDITKVYFRFHSGGPITYTNFTINLGQPSNGAFNPSTTFHTGLTTVLSAASYTIDVTGLTGGDWIAFPLTTSFEYDPTKPLVVEVTNTAGSGSTLNARYTSKTGQKLYSTTSATATTGTAHTLWQDIGFTVIPTTVNDAGLTQIFSPTTPGVPGVSTPVVVTLKNYGTATLTEADINWSVNGATQTLYHWTGSLAKNASTNVTIGNFNFPAGTNTIDAFTSSPNGQADEGSDNNEANASVLFCNPMPAVVTVDQTGTPGPALFTSFGELATALSQCGITGNVTVNVLNGPYNEQVVFNNIPGAGPSARVTINGNGQILTSTTTATDRYVLRLNNAAYLTINNLDIQQGTFTTGWIGIQLLNGNNVTVSNCKVTSTNSTSVLVGGIIGNGDATGFTTGGNFSNITITGNTITGPGKGINFYGLDASLAPGLVISNNIIRSTGSDGIFFSATTGASVSGNDIDFLAGDGIEIYQDNVNATVFNNKITSEISTNTGTLRGMYVSTSSTGTRLYNNLIWKMNAPGANIYGIGASSTSEVYHNTVILNNTSATGALSVGFFEDATNSGSILKNNIFYVTRPATAWAAGIALSSASTVATAITSTSNVFWIPVGHVAVRRATTAANTPTNLYTTLSDWNTASGEDAVGVSFETDPNFQANTAIPSSGIINGKGETGLNITTDISGATRTSPPDPGAYEFSPAADDAAITNFIVPSLPYCNTSLDVQFELTNAGSGNLTSAKIDWTVNGVTQTQVNWAGSLASGASTIVTLGTVPVTGSNLYNFSAAVSLPNGNVDANAANDGFTYTGFRRGMDGIFTINKTIPASATNYISVQSLANDLAFYGVCSPVTVNVEAGTGPYTEQVTFSPIPGTSTTNTVVLNGNHEILQFTATSAFPSDFTVKFDSVKYVTLENFRIMSLHATNGTGVYITRHSTDITIRKNVIEVSTSATASTTFGILATGSSSYLLNGTRSENLLITENTIVGGYSAVQLTGVNFSSVTQKIQNSVVSKNIIQDFYGYGIYLNYTDGVSVDSNQITRPARTNSGSDSQTPAGIIASAGSTNFVIERNTIGNLFTSMTGTELAKIARGVYVSGTTTAQSSGIIQNNLIHGFTNTGSQYGIQNNSLVGPIRILHNTIALNDVANTGASSASTVALYMSNSSAQNGTEVKNNIFYITRGGASSKRIYDFSGSANSFVSDYNVLYLNASSGDNAIASIGSVNYSSLADWQTTGKDLNSVSADPQFVNPSSGDFNPSNYFTDGGIMGTQNVGVNNDIEAILRDVNPDPGAFEFTLPPCTTPAAGTPQTSLNYVCSGEAFILNLTGINPGSGLEFYWESSADGNAWVSASAPSASPTFNTTISANTYFRAVSVCSGGAEVRSGSIQIFVRNPLIGIYTIDKNAPSSISNFLSFNDAVYAMRCGIAGAVTFNVIAGSGPYNEQVVITPVSGASSANTITFNGNGEILEYVSTISAQRAVLKLDGADYVTINNLVINSPGTTTSHYGYGVQLLNDADNNTISNCTITANTSLASTNFAGIMINSSATGVVTTTGNSGCDDNLLTGNTIIGGNVGIGIIANGSTSQVLNNSVINNLVKDFYSHGIYLNGGVNTLIELNDISKPNRSGTTTTFYGINLVGNSNNTIISKNRIHEPFRAATTSTSDAYGIRLNNANAVAGSETVISNNIVYDFMNNGDHYGIQINGGDNVKIYHNTVSLEDGTTTCTSCFTRAIFIESATTVGVDIRNNILSIGRGGSGDKQSMFLAPANVSAFTIDNNVHYINPSVTGTSEVARMGGTSYITLANWQTTGKDLSSSSDDPQFLDAASGDFTPQQTTINNTGAPVGITTDILNMSRSAANPDPGAYEFGGPLPVTFLTFRGEVLGSINKLTWSTATETNNKGFELERSVDGRNYSSIMFIPSKSESGNSSAVLNYSCNDARPNAGNNYYRLKQIDKDGKFSYSSMILLNRKVSEITLSNIYPNPTNRELNLVITSHKSEKVMIVITDLTGKIIMQRSIQLAIGDNKQMMNIQNLSAGTYLIKALCNSGCESAAQRIVKQ